MQLCQYHLIQASKTGAEAFLARRPLRELRFNPDCNEEN